MQDDSPGALGQICCFLGAHLAHFLEHLGNRQDLSQPVLQDLSVGQLKNSGKITLGGGQGNLKKIELTKWFCFHVGFRYVSHFLLLFMSHMCFFFLQVAHCPSLHDTCLFLL